MHNRFTTLAISLGLVCAAAFPASAQEAIEDGAHHVPRYHSWQAGWDRDDFDRHHVILGTVVRFAPYRLQVAVRDGFVQTIDLKRGTVILPTGATPGAAARVAVIGYYSRGTFIANRVLLRE